MQPGKTEYWDILEFSSRKSLNNTAYLVEDFINGNPNGVTSRCLLIDTSSSPIIGICRTLFAGNYKLFRAIIYLSPGESLGSIIIIIYHHIISIGSNL
jgi:hypothetical protein